MKSLLLIHYCSILYRNKVLDERTAPLHGLLVHLKKIAPLCGSHPHSLFFANTITPTPITVSQAFSHWIPAHHTTFIAPVSVRHTSACREKYRPHSPKTFTGIIILSLFVVVTLSGLQFHVTFPSSPIYTYIHIHVSTNRRKTHTRLREETGTPASGMWWSCGRSSSGCVSCVAGVTAAARGGGPRLSSSWSRFFTGNQPAPVATKVALPFTHTHRHVYMYVCACVHVCIHTLTHSHTHTHIHTQTHEKTHAKTPTDR